MLFDCLEVQPKQSVLLVSDVKQTHAALAFLGVAAKAHVEMVSLSIPERPNSQPRLSPFFKNLIQTAELAIILLPKLDSESLNWLRQQNRAHVILFPQVDDETVLPSLETAQRPIRERCRKLADILTIGRNLQLGAANGTSLKMSMAHARGNAEVAPFLAETFYAALPIGRAYLIPQIESVQGEIFLDSVAGQRGSTANIYLKIIDGRIKLIKGDKIAGSLRRQLRVHGGDARQVVEIGFGLNDKARLGNSAFEDEKVLGTIHLGFGRLPSGSKIPEVFARGILQAPTVTIDGKKIIEEGKVLVG